MKPKQRLDIKKRYLGAIITPQNKGEFIKRYKQDYITRIENQGNPEGYSDSEIAVLAKGYANFMVKREKKHLKAFLKGYKNYKLYGEVFPVMTVEMFENNISGSKTEEE